MNIGPTFMVFVPMFMNFGLRTIVFVLMFMVLVPMFMNLGLRTIVFVLMFMVFVLMFMNMGLKTIVFVPMFMVLVPMFMNIDPLSADITLVSAYGVAGSDDIALRPQVARRRTGVGTPAFGTTSRNFLMSICVPLRPHRCMLRVESRMAVGSLMA